MNWLRRWLIYKKNRLGKAETQEEPAGDAADIAGEPQRDGGNGGDNGVDIICINVRLTRKMFRYFLC